MQSKRGLFQPTMNKRLLLLIALVGMLHLVPSVSAKDRKKEALPVVTQQTQKLDPMEVKVNPFALWGIGIWGHAGLWNRITGGPLDEMYVSCVAAGSPAYLAGVQCCDEILAVDGVPKDKLRVSGLKKHFYNTERGEKVLLELRDCATGMRRTVEIDVKSNKTWKKTDGSAASCYWGIEVRFPGTLGANGTMSPKVRRILRYESVQVVDKSKPKKNQVTIQQKPIYIFRRAAVLTWAEKSLVLIERENRAVELIETDKVPQHDAVVGRIIYDGAVLVLSPGGMFELLETPRKLAPEAGETPAAR